jgi:SAM-dependent methyltransferase
MTEDVEASYSGRAAEYIERFGSMSSVHPSDAQLVKEWAAHIDGPVLDAGCGPGHWTSFLAENGNDARGVDQVAGFIHHAREAYPAVRFDVGSVDALTEDSGSVGGILAWYSLIHHELDRVQLVLKEFARVLRPGGGLLLGFFTGPNMQAFDHSVATAYWWSAEGLTERLQGAGFEVIEAHTRTGLNSRPRPHGAILARLRPGFL